MRFYLHSNTLKTLQRIIRCRCVHADNQARVSMTGIASCQEMGLLSNVCVYFHWYGTTLYHIVSRSVLICTNHIWFCKLHYIYTLHIVDINILDSPIVYKCLQCNFIICCFSGGLLSNAPVGWPWSFSDWSTGLPFLRIGSWQSYVGSHLLGMSS